MRTTVSYTLAVMLLYMSGLSAFGQTDPMPLPTRWMTDIDMPTKPLHDIPSQQGPLLLHEVLHTTSSPTQEDAFTGRICFVIENTAYAAISNNFHIYLTQVQQSGFTPLVYTYSSGTATELRNYLISLYNEPASLVGAEFIGDIPYIIYEMIQNWGDGDEYEDFPCDMFFMDMDGNWADSLNSGSVQANNGKYDTWTGNTDIEIWVSRLKTRNLTSLGSETSILTNYYARNISYRRGLLNRSAGALLYNDDDWWTMMSSDQYYAEQLYSNVTTVSATETTTATDYKSRIPTSYEFIQTRSHGYPGGHGYYQNSRATFNYVRTSDYRTIDPPALFYSFFVCSGSDYTYDNYLAGTAAFNSDSGLLAWGSTKTGGIWSDQQFYYQIRDTFCFGAGFVTWFNAVNEYSFAPRWWYGMVLIGDASLAPSAFMGRSAAETFSFRAFALTNSVSLRWSCPTNCGMLNDTVHIRFRTDTYPTDTGNGTELYTGSNTSQEHNNLVPGQTYYYTIWVSDDGSTFIDPP